VVATPPASRLPHSLETQRHMGRETNAALSVCFPFLHSLLHLPTINHNNLNSLDSLNAFKHTLHLHWYSVHHLPYFPRAFSFATGYSTQSPYLSILRLAKTPSPFPCRISNTHHCRPLYFFYSLSSSLIATIAYCAVRPRRVTQGFSSSRLLSSLTTWHLQSPQPVRHSRPLSCSLPVIPSFAPLSLSSSQFANFFGSCQSQWDKCICLFLRLSSPLAAC
jgi:hypothetical protein